MRQTNIVKQREYLLKSRATAQHNLLDDTEARHLWRSIKSIKLLASERIGARVLVVQLEAHFYDHFTQLL